MQIKSKFVIISALIILTISGCCSFGKCVKSQEPVKIKAPNSGTKLEIPLMPNWFLNQQNSDYCIGFSLRSYDRETMKDGAKQMAAVMKSRNNSAYSVKKYAKTESDNFYKNGSADFHLEVSSDPAVPQQIYDNLTLIDSFFINDNFVGLFAQMKIEVNNSKKLPHFPDWALNKSLRIENSKAISVGKATSASLIPAYEAAVQNAREKILGYYITSVNSAIINIDQSLQSDVAVESAGKLVSMQINHCFVTSMFRDELFSYEVQVEMEMALK